MLIWLLFPISRYVLIFYVFKVIPSSPFFHPVISASSCEFITESGKILEGLNVSASTPKPSPSIARTYLNLLFEPVGGGLPPHYALLYQASRFQRLQSHSSSEFQGLSSGGFECLLGSLINLGGPIIEVITNGECSQRTVCDGSKSDKNQVGHED